jgi:hypothetical protein
MGMIMAVSFERHGRLYYLDPGGAHEPRIGDKVLVPTARITSCLSSSWRATSLPWYRHSARPSEALRRTPVRAPAGWTR